MRLAMMMLRLSLFALAVTVLLDSAQAATSAGVAAQQQWGVMDKCVKMAIAKFPDHTAEALAKRDEYTRICQRDSRVPVREGLTPK
jgi:hypothetical protein